MKVLVATRERQDEKPNDFCEVPEGELVLIPIFQCRAETAADRCGCKRSLYGIEHYRGTTTFKVMDRMLTLNMFQTIIHETLDRILSGGRDPRHRFNFVSAFRGHSGVAISQTKTLTRIAAHFPVGTVLERDDKSIRPRT